MVANRWFYLLVNGGTVNGITVEGIGFDKAEIIAYRTLTYFLGITSTFTSTRDASITAASQLYGTESCEARSVRNAWAAVGVGTANTTACFPPLYVGIDGPSSVQCGTAGTWTAYVAGGNGVYTYQWAFFMSGAWLNIGNTNTLTFSPGGCCGTELDLRLTVISGSQSASNTRDVYVYPCTKEAESPEMISSPGETDIIIYPNPSVNKYISIFIPELQDHALIEIYDLQGKLIQSEVTSSETSELHLEKVSPGIYVMRIVAEGTQHIRRISVGN